LANGKGYASGEFVPPSVDTSPSPVGASNPLPTQQELLVEILAELKEIKILLAAQHRQYTIPTIPVYPSYPRPMYPVWWGQQVSADGSGVSLQNTGD